MSGWVKLNRDVTEVDLWKEIVPLRLYLLLLTKATRDDGRMVSGVRLKRGQYIRAFSKLVEDLGYREGRGEKHYAKSTIKRSVDKLVKKRLIAVEETNMGTLFTLLHCEDIQAKGFIDFFCPSFRGTMTERTENKADTNPEQNQEREKKEEKLENRKNQENGNSTQSKDQTTRMTAITEHFLKLRNRGAILSAKDMQAIEKVAKMEVSLEKLLNWMTTIHSNYQQKSPQQTINSMAYYEAAIMTRLRKMEWKEKKETLHDRIARLEIQGILM
ncbi:hypothetical protein J2Z40_003496 [Cytobacillus eiseniae]|uniref:Uncharacterized protein n=1 Tax=Cytobacillus eiseniae TaxID=762947 RepID=A0ABS4RJL1_9BACI|nr:hypothetical protein [Cytobacillus eiseniae]MBP2242914.1 hypothetical protein [Cytobacillus eiseniae]